jgi:hypothetical protein
METGRIEIRLLGSRPLSDTPERNPARGGHIRVSINGIAVADDAEFGLEELGDVAICRSQRR